MRGFLFYAQRANISASAPSSIQMLAVTISKVRLKYARVGIRASCALMKSRSSSIAAKPAQA
jgi:hypothetical protein